MSVEHESQVELELHTSVEGLQVQVRALATAIDHLCRSIEAMGKGPATSSEVTTGVEEARLALGEVW